MKKIALGIGVILLLTLIMPAFGSGTEVGTFECGIGVDGYGTAEHQYSVSAYYTQYIINGNRWKLTCLGHLDPGVIPPEKSVKLNNEKMGYFCGFGDIYPIYTTDWQTVINPNGEVSLICHGRF